MLRYAYTILTIEPFEKLSFVCLSTSEIFVEVLNQFILFGMDGFGLR